MRRRIIVEAMKAMVELWVEGKQNRFSTAEIAKQLGIEKWRVRRSLKATAKADFTLVWADGDDIWCFDQRYVRLEQFLKNRVV
ncbi:MAG: hypothetical protein WC516_05230 [Patescibacteria group bacterium]|jgi:DNA-binding transcriptional regulator LsrR (DeoR family)